SDSVALTFVDSKESSCAVYTFLHRDERPDSANEHRTLRRIFRVHVLRRCQIDGTLRHLTSFRVVLKTDLFLGEELLEDVRMLELSANSVPLVALSSDVDGLIDETECIVCSFVLEGVPVLPCELHDRLYDLRSRVGDLDRVRLDVDRGETLLHQVVLQVDHEQRSPLRDNIVLIARVRSEERRVGKEWRGEEGV